MARHFDALSTLLIVRLLSEGASEREAAERAKAGRAKVRRIAAELREGRLTIRKDKEKKGPRIKTNGGRRLAHEELLIALVKRAAVNEVNR